MQKKMKKARSARERNERVAGEKEQDEPFGLFRGEERQVSGEYIDRDERDCILTSRGKERVLREAKRERE